MLFLCATQCHRMLPIRKCYHAQPCAAYAQPMCPRSTEMPTLVLPKCCLTCPLHVLGLSALPKCHLCAAATLPNCNHKQSVPNALPNASTPLCFRIDSDGYRSATSMLGATKCSRTPHGMLSPHCRMLPQCDPNNDTTTLPNTTVRYHKTTYAMPTCCTAEVLPTSATTELPMRYHVSANVLPTCCTAEAPCPHVLPNAPQVLPGCYQLAPKCNLSAT